MTTKLEMGPLPKNISMTLLDKNSK